MRFVFFGTPEFSVTILATLKREGYIPTLIVTQEAKPKGRNMHISPTPVHDWATDNSIKVISPAKLKDNVEVLELLKNEQADCFVVAAYGKILQKELIQIPRKGVLNVHPSLLPKFRGPSPIESAILSDEQETGVTIMLIDDQLDHGDIIAQQTVPISEWPPTATTLEHKLAVAGAELLARNFTPWVDGTISATPQNHDLATFTKKIEKTDALLDLSAPPAVNIKKIKAYDKRPGAYFYFDEMGENTRVRVTDAKITNGELEILKVIPEGKKEMNYTDFLRGRKTIRQ